MPALTLPAFGFGPDHAALGDGVRAAGRVEPAAFRDTLNRKVAEEVAVEGPRGAAPAQAAAPAGLENDAAARDRVRRSLELAPGGGATEGDAILNGLKTLRGAFDARSARVGEIMAAQSVDSRALLAMQMEVAQYSLLVDVSSKLTGKTTQSLDALMKGQ